MTSVFGGISGDSIDRDIEKRRALALSDIQATLAEIDDRLLQYRESSDQRMLGDIYLLLNIFSDANQVTDYILAKTFGVFVDACAALFRKEDWSALEILIDIFRYDVEFVVSDRARAALFVKAASPMITGAAGLSPISVQEIFINKTKYLLERARIHMDGLT
jgi:hypothetical protein